jgi:hypothetical protein
VPIVDRHAKTVAIDHYPRRERSVSRHLLRIKMLSSNIQRVRGSQAHREEIEP